MAYIINPHGILHSIPDSWPLPKGSRLASATEVTAWQQEDAAQRSRNLADKRAKAAQRAQLVVMPASEPAQTATDPQGGVAQPSDAPELTVPPATDGGKEKKDGK